MCQRPLTGSMCRTACNVIVSVLLAVVALVATTLAAACPHELVKAVHEPLHGEHKQRVRRASCHKPAFEVVTLWADRNEVQEGETALHFHEQGSAVAGC